MSLLSDADKNEIGAIFDEVVNTFLRPVTYYKTPVETLISESPDHNAFFMDAEGNSTTQLVQESGYFNGRILHGKRYDESSLRLLNRDLDGSNNILLREGECRMKVDASGKSILDNSERIVIDGILFQKETDARPHGLFTPNYYTFYLKRVS